MSKAEVAVLPPEPVTPMQMLQTALSKGASIEQMAQLLDLQDRWEKMEARKAFVVAMNAFKANPPAVLKTVKVAFGQTKYSHASLDDASEIIGSALAQVGISHRWNVEQTEGKIRVTCILTHSLGHSEQVPMEATPDTSGSKNSIQAIGSAVSYLQRYTLFTAAGIAPKNVDDDGRGGVEVHQMDPRVKAEYAASIDALDNRKAAEVLWQQIATESTRSGDVAAYAELKAAVSAKVKTLAKEEL